MKKLKRIMVIENIHVPRMKKRQSFELMSGERREIPQLQIDLLLWEPDFEQTQLPRYILIKIKFCIRPGQGVHCQAKKPRTNLLATVERRKLDKPGRT